MVSYEVVILVKDQTGGVGYRRRSLTFLADDFAHAEEQAAPYIMNDEEIIEIRKDYVA